MNQLTAPPVERNSDAPSSSREPASRGVQWLKRCPNLLSLSLILTAYVFLICMRLPDAIRACRFWGEGGTVFFANAASKPWLHALFHSYRGYINLSANLAGLVSFYCAPLETAPYLSMAIGVIGQLVPALLLCMSDAPLLKNKTFLMAALLILIAQPNTAELWLSPIGWQYFLSVAVGCILAFPLDSAQWKRMVQYALLLFAPLCGPLSSFLLPLFLLRALIERSRARIYQSACLVLGTAIQIFFFYHPTADRAMQIDWRLLLEMIGVKHIVLPLLGRSHALEVCGQLYGLFVRGIIPAWTIQATCFCITLLVACILFARSRTAWWLALAASTLIVLSLPCVLGEQAAIVQVDAGGRYTYPAQVLMDMAILVMACEARYRLINVCCSITITWLLMMGIAGYRDDPPIIKVGPSWRTELRSWRKHPEQPLKIWPTGWELQLPKELATQKM